MKESQELCIHITGYNLVLRWRHNERDGVSNHQPHDCLLNRLFRPRSSKIRVTDLWEGNSPVTGGFPAQRASNVENISISWRNHGMYFICLTLRRPHLIGGKIPVIDLSQSSYRLSSILGIPLPIKRRVLVNSGHVTQILTLLSFLVTTYTISRA